MERFPTEQGPDGDSPVRVLWLIKGLGPGGAEQLLVSAARVTDHERFAVEAAYVRPDKTQLAPALEKAGVRTHCLTHGKAGRLLWPFRLRKLMAGFDIVHAHSPLLAGVARPLARTLPRRPLTVSTEHNVWSSFTRPTRLLNALTAALDAQRWAVSEEALASMWPPLRRGASVLIHGIVQNETPPDTDARPRLRAELGIPDDAVVAVTVANFRREKDYPNLLRAARRAFDADPRLWIVAVGQGPLEADVRALHADLGLGDRFILTGYRSDVPDLLAASDIFTLGSAFEGLPVSIMEAMAAGLPVVATAVGGVPEAVVTGQPGETGLLIAPHDDRALADALLELSRDPERRARMATAARQRAGVFDIRTAVAVQSEAYARLAGQRRRSRLAPRTSSP
jgi:glycosyltransferase involved in cell wall biosynthesis